MAWVRLDDTFPEHPKVLQVGGDAAWLHVCALAYCNRNETDGMVTLQVLPRLSDRRRPTALAELLVAAGMWDLAPGGWTIHDYLKFQPSRETMERKRAEARDRMNKVRSGSQDVRANNERSSLNPDPSRPDPSRENKSSLNSESVGATGEDDLVRRIIGEIARLRAAHHKPDSRDAWTRSVIKNFRTDELPALQAFLEERPEIREEDQWEAAARIFEMYRVNRSAS